MPLVPANQDRGCTVVFAFRRPRGAAPCPPFRRDPRTGRRYGAHRRRPGPDRPALTARPGAVVPLASRPVPAYPPAPWRLAGPVAIVPSLRTGAVLLLGLYGERSTLRYGEIAATIGPVVRSMYVDDERSLAGGREMWAVPKERMTLRWRGGERTEAEAYDAAGSMLVRARWAGPRVRLPMPCLIPFVGTLGDTVRVAWLAGALRAGPVTIDLEVPEESPLAALGLAGRRPGLAGRIDVTATRPRRLDS
jgi:hypothetical protein